ncbi:hypothetical protein PAMP_020241 [Pampus punctatissimus]
MFEFLTVTSGSRGIITDTVWTAIASDRRPFIGQCFEVELKRGCQLPSLLTDITIMHFTKSHYLFILAESFKLWQHLARPQNCSVFLYGRKMPYHTTYSHLTV